MLIYSTIESLIKIISKVVNTLRKVLFVVSIFIIIYGLFIGATGFTDKGFDKNHGHFMGWSFGAGRGASMLPTLDEELNFFLSKKVDIEDIGVGDVIKYKVDLMNEYGGVDEELVVHRVIDKHKEGFITKGDGNDYVDRWVVYPENVYGRVEYAFKGWKLKSIISITPQEVWKTLLNY